LKHAPFWEAPDVFDELLGRFIDDICAMTRGRRPVAAGALEASAQQQHIDAVAQSSATSLRYRTPSIGLYTTSLGEVTRCEGLFSL
jgi:hypothetical protein